MARGLRRAVEILRGYRQHDPQQLVSRDYGQMIAGTADRNNVNESTFRDHEQQLRDFVKWCVQKLKIRQKLPQIKFQDAKEGSDQHRTGYYDDAKQKANDYVSVLVNQKIGRALMISDNSYTNYPRPVFSEFKTMALSDAGLSKETLAIGEIEIIANVSVTFNLE